MALRSILIVGLGVSCVIGILFVVFQDRGVLPPVESSISENKRGELPLSTEITPTQPSRVISSSSPAAPVPIKRLLIPEELRDEVRFLEMMYARDPERGKRIFEIAQAWAEIDPWDALAWAASLDPTEGILASRPALVRMGRSYPAEAFNTINSMEELSPQLRDRARFVVLDFWAQQDFEACWEAARTLNDNDQRIQVQGHLLSEQSSSNPEVAAEVLKKLSVSTGEAIRFQDVAATIARNLIRDEVKETEVEEFESGVEAGDAAPVTLDGGAAVEWALELPKGPLRTAALSGAIGSWTVIDPEGASDWVNNYAAGPERDAMIEEMTTMSRAPDVSFLWASQAMTLGDARNRVLARSAIGWIDLDPDNAWQTIKSSSDISAEDRAFIQESWENYQLYKEN